MVDRRWQHKDKSRTNEKTIRSVVHAIDSRKREWEKAGIIPKIRQGKVVERSSLTEGGLSDG